MPQDNGMDAKPPSGGYGKHNDPRTSSRDRAYEKKHGKGAKHRDGGAGSIGKETFGQRVIDGILSKVFGR